MLLCLRGQHPLHSAVEERDPGWGGLQGTRSTGPGTPVGVVCRAQGLQGRAAGRTCLQWHTRFRWAAALNLRPPLSYPRS
eukprot:8460245-Pyramimonas_sp.AAC.3